MKCCRAYLPTHDEAMHDGVSLVGRVGLVQVGVDEWYGRGWKHAYRDTDELVHLARARFVALDQIYEPVDNSQREENDCKRANAVESQSASNSAMSSCSKYACKLPRATHMHAIHSRASSVLLVLVASCADT